MDGAGFLKTIPSFDIFNSVNADRLHCHVKEISMSYKTTHSKMKFHILMFLLLFPYLLNASITCTWDAENLATTISSDSDDPIKITVNQWGWVLINDAYPPGVSFKASDVKYIVVKGGPGDNVIDLSNVGPADFTIAEAVSVEGFGGNDRITGSQIWNNLYGGDGNDIVYGGNQGDILNGGSGDDIIYGGSGEDTISGDTGDDFLYGGEGDDTLIGHDGSDNIYGENGNDYIHGHAGNDILDGGQGNDKISGDEGNDEIDGKSGNDTIYGDDGDDLIWGGEDNDNLSGGDGHDKLFGGEGKDFLEGDNGDDILNGENGQDYCIGNDGDDRLLGGEGDDRFSGGPGNDEIIGGPGNDYIFEEPGSIDVLSDSTGVDTLDFSLAASAISIDLDLDVGQGVNTENDSVVLQGEFEHFIGSPFDDVVHAGPLTLPRSLDGGEHTDGDTLIFDAQNTPAIQTEATITVNGFEPVTYINFEYVRLINSGPRAVDRIEVIPDNVELQIGATHQFAALAYDDQGDTVQTKIVWTATAGDIDSTGLYTATLTGSHMVIAADSSGTASDTARVQVLETGLANMADHVLEFRLHQNIPNPFNPRTIIPYTIAKRNHIRLVIYDLLGRELVTLVDKIKNPGTHTVIFDATNLASGLYFYSLQSEDYIDIRKMVLLE